MTYFGYLLLWIAIVRYPTAVFNIWAHRTVGMVSTWFWPHCHHIGNVEPLLWHKIQRYLSEFGIEIWYMKLFPIIHFAPPILLSDVCELYHPELWHTIHWIRHKALKVWNIILWCNILSCGVWILNYDAKFSNGGTRLSSRYECLKLFKSVVKMSHKDTEIAWFSWTMAFYESLSGHYLTLSVF